MIIIITGSFTRNCISFTVSLSVHFLSPIPISSPALELLTLLILYLVDLSSFSAAAPTENLKVAAFNLFQQYIKGLQINSSRKKFGESGITTVVLVMNCLFNAYSATLISRTSCVVLRSSGFSTLSFQRRFEHAAVKLVNIDLLLTRFSVRCYAARRAKGSKSVLEKVYIKPKAMVKEESNSFFLVRKGDLVGVYKNLSDCQEQVGSSICDPPVSVYKGQSMPKDTETYLLSRGLKNALYSIRAADLTEGLFGSLVACPFLQPSQSEGETAGDDILRKRSLELRDSEISDAPGSLSLSNSSRKHAKLDRPKTDVSVSAPSCILEFDGASKGNPGQAGAGVILRADDGTVICRLREGLGIATNNVAEYRAMILGLRFALEKGFTSIRVKGDSKLVCMQVKGLWKVKNEGISKWFEEAKKLKDKFSSFEISHVLRDLNSDADAQANLAVSLADGQVQED